MSSGTLSWLADLKNLSQAVENRQKGESRPGVLYRLQWSRHDLFSGVEIALLKGMDAHKARPWAANEQVLTQPPRFMEEEDIPILRRLLTLPCSKNENGVHNIFSLDCRILPAAPDDCPIPLLLSDMLATGRLFAGTPPVILAEGSPRQGEIVWREGNPQPIIQANPPATNILKTWPLWYLDWQKGQLGLLDLPLAPETLAALQTLTESPEFNHSWHEVEYWDAELLDEKDGWLGLDMGVFVAGKREPLAPMLSNLIRRESRWLDALQLADIPDTEIVDLFTEDGRRLKVEAERIKPLARLLIDLFDGYREDKPALRISRFDAPRLEQFKDRWQFRGDDSILALAARLKDSHGVKEVTPPRGIKLELRDYQRQGLAWLQYLREHNLSGILADDMGLGKTAQTLAHLLMEKEAGRLTSPALVILPTSLIFNWKNEAASCAPDLKVLSLHGQERDSLFDSIPEYDMVLTTYPLLWRDSARLTKHEYHLLVLDEAQMIKNSRSRSSAIVRLLQARHRLCLTGTPLENHLGEIWTQFDFLLPGFLGDQRSFVRLWRNPIEKRGNILRRDLLARRIHPFILRRKKDEVAKELPEKTTIIRKVELSGDQRDLYEAVRAAMDKRVRLEIAQHGFTRSQIIILDALLKLRQVCCDPRLVKSVAAKKIQEKAKLNLLMDMLPEMAAEGRRILLFSQFTAMLDLIRQELDQIGLPYAILTGETKDRETPVTAFQSGKVPLFLISLKAGGVGLNLTAADTVIHYDPWWNPAVENQATDRAHRIGQDKPVFVYKLIVADSIEEKIIAMQEQKADLAAGILSENMDKQVKFDAADLNALFEPLPKV